LNSSCAFNTFRKAKFEIPLDKGLQNLDCEPTQRDEFIKRLFKNKNKKFN
jgi:penicillin-binding protein 1A